MVGADLKEGSGLQSLEGTSYKEGEHREGEMEEGNR